MFFTSVLIGSLFGLYDFFIKLSSGKINPVVGPVVCQTFSAISAFLFLLIFYYFNRRGVLQYAPTTTRIGFFFSAVAGALITVALISLFFFFTNRGVKVSTALPTVLVLRNITLILLGVLILKENLGIIKILGLALSLLGIFLISG